MAESEFERLTSLVRRAPVLEACRDGPVGRSTIAERADCSRATAYRATDFLDERGLVERAADGYVLTGAGRATLAQLEEFRAGMAGTERLAPLLSVTESSELVDNAHLLDDATVVEDDPATPYRIDQHVVSIIDGTDETIAGVTGSFGSPTTIARTFERIEAGVEFEWTFPRPMLDRLRSQHDDITESLLAHENTAFYVVDDVAVDVALYDGTLVVMGFDDERGILSAVATTDDPRAVDWGRGVLAAHRARAEQVA